MKKFKSIAIIVALILSFGNISAYAAEPPYEILEHNHEVNRWLYNLKDVSSDDWYYPILPAVYDMMKGVSDTEFAPNALMTRGMFITILYRFAGEPAAEGDNLFTDVQQGMWYEDAIVWAASNQIVQGMDETHFAPGMVVTREQIAVMLKRFVEAQSYNIFFNSNLFDKPSDYDAFPDTEDVSVWAKDAMEWAVKYGLIRGTAKGLEPRASATRAQTAQVIYNLSMTL